MESQNSTELSDYIAALKRRRMLLVYIALPIIAITVALSVGLPDKYVSKSLIEFAQAEISGELPAAQATGEELRRTSTSPSAGLPCARCIGQA